MATGIVYLVGAGPGDPGLITVRGLECIRSADLLAYDRLVSPALVAQARPGAELVYVGKEVSRHGRKQEEISLLLAEEALQGKVVCRLKGGDPFVFGRGGEEAELLAARGVPFEVVPGITSGIAAAACAGIPVTHRDYSGSVTLVAGHEAPDKSGPSVDWSRMAGSAETLLIYMGIENLAHTASELIAGGRAPETPVAVIRWGARAEQQTVTGTLEGIARAVAEAGLKPPAMIVVGEVVALRDRLAWAERRPLHGHRVLVPLTSPGAQAPSLAKELRRLGAEVWEWPVPRPELAPLLRAALAEGAVQTVAFPSAAAVSALLRQVGDAALLRELAILSADPETSRSAARAGLGVPAEVGA